MDNGPQEKLVSYGFIIIFFMCFTLYNVLNVNKSVLGGGDPHFMIRIKGMTHPLCFDFPANPGDVLRLLSDTKSGSCLICFNC